MSPDPSPDERSGLERLTGGSRVIARVRDQIRHLAATRATVLLKVRPGTGTSPPRAIHQASARRDRPFVSVSASALPESWLDSELSATNASARKTKLRAQAVSSRPEGGTLFLDDVDAVHRDQVAPSHSQTARTSDRRKCQPGRGRECSPRPIATSPPRFARAFRDDLLPAERRARQLPPLRGRLEDLPRLTEMFLRELNRELGRVPGSRVAAERSPRTRGLATCVSFAARSRAWSRSSNATTARAVRLAGGAARSRRHGGAARNLGRHTSRRGGGS